MTRSTSVSVHQLQMSLIGLLIYQLNMPVNAFSIANHFISRIYYSEQLSHDSFLLHINSSVTSVISGDLSSLPCKMTLFTVSGLLTTALWLQSNCWAKDALFILLQEMTSYSPQHLDSASRSSSFKLDAVSARWALTVKLCKPYESQNGYKAIS